MAVQMGSWRLLTAAGQPTASGAAGPTGQLVRWMATVGASYSLIKMTGVETVAFAVAMIMAKSSLAAFCSMTAACSMIVTRSTTSVCSVAVARSVTVASAAVATRRLGAQAVVGVLDHYIASLMEERKKPKVQETTQVY